MRSISLYGLSDMILTFDEGTDDYFARQVVFERMSQAQSSHRRHAVHGAALQPQRPRLSLRHREPRPQPAGAEDLRGLGDRARLSLGPRRRRRLRLRRHGHAVSGAARSRAPLRLSPHRSADHQLAHRQQLQRRRRILLAGRAVLLRARPRPGARHRGHRRHRCRRQQWRAHSREGHRHGRDRLRAAPRRVRLREEQ